MRTFFIVASIAVATLVPCLAEARAVTELLSVDASDASAQVWHATLRIPIAVTGGDIALVYPKWKPGNHAPTGPIANLGMLRATAAGENVTWTREDGDPYAFHFAVPRGAAELDLAYDLYEGSPSGGNMSAHIGVLDWNQVLFLPKGAPMRDVTVAARIALPPQWTEASALALAQPAANFTTPSGTVAFAPAPVETLIDSPVYCGAFERVVALTSANGMTNEVDLFGESPIDVEPTTAQIARWKNLVAETDALFGARHWRHYHFLVSLSDTVQFRGLEHHQSSADGVGERYLSDDVEYREDATLLPHEFAHSWNGKYRRPAGLITEDFQQPEDTELLWVYEGLNEYLGEVLAARSGLNEPGAFEETLADTYASLDIEPGRRTRPLGDTAKMQVIGRLGGGAQGFYPERRGADYYSEGELLWLDADTLIRTRSHGRRSLEDFDRRFFGGADDPEKVLGYTRADVIAALSAVQPYDWAGFFRTRVDDVLPHPEADGIRRAGWRLVYTPQRDDWQIRLDRKYGGIDARYSLGARIGEDGEVSNPVEGMPLARAGVGDGDKLIGIDDMTYSTERLRAAIRAAQYRRTPIALIVDRLGAIRTLQCDYRGGERYPHLVRNASLPDMLATITAPERRR